MFGSRCASARGWTFWRVFGSQWRADPDYWWKNLVDRLAHMEIAPIGAEARDERLTEKRIVGDGIDQPSAAEPGKDQAPALDLGPFRERREGNLASTSPSKRSRDLHQALSQADRVNVTTPFTALPELIGKL